MHTAVAEVNRLGVLLSAVALYCWHHRQHAVRFQIKCADACVVELAAARWAFSLCVSMFALHAPGDKGRAVALSMQARGDARCWLWLRNPADALHVHGADAAPGL